MEWQTMSDVRSHLWNEAIAAYERGDFDECRRHCESALQDEPQNADYNFLLGVSLAEAGRVSDAEGPILRSLELQPDNAPGWAAYGNVLSALCKNEKALEIYNRALGLDNTNFVAWLNLGVLLHKLGRFEEALISYSNSLELIPYMPVALSNRALSLHELGRYSEALVDLDLVTQIEPYASDGYLHRGNVHQALKDFSSARLDYVRAMQLNEQNIQAIIGHGNALAGMGHLEDGERELHKCIAMCPTSSDAYYNLGNIQRDRKDMLGAQRSYDKAIEIDPEYISARRNKGFVTLLSGDFEGGLPLYELRKKLVVPIDARTFSSPEWSGKEDVAGKTVFIYTDQGLGDTIQFSRLLRELNQRGAKVIFAAQDGLRHLLRASFPTVHFIPKNEIPSHFDFHLPLASLPYLLGITIGTIPAEVPYLRADATLVQYWKEHIGANNFKIGVAWQGAIEGDVERSFSAQFFEGIGKIPGVRLISVQTGFGTEQLKSIPSSVIERFEGLDKGTEAFKDTAALMECLDLIVTPDTSLAHLAGALDRPVCVMLKEVPDWRWMLNRNDSPWYPSMRLIRQPAFGDWTGAFALLKNEILRRKNYQ